MTKKNQSNIGKYNGPVSTIQTWTKHHRAKEIRPFLLQMMHINISKEK